MQAVKTFFILHKKVVLFGFVILVLLFLLGIYLVGKNNPLIGHLSKRDMPTIQIEAYGKLYDGVPGSSCWDGICRDFGEITSPSPIFIQAGMSGEIKIKAYSSPKSLTATIIRPDGTEQKIIPLSPVLQGASIPITMLGEHVVHISGVWPLGDISYTFKIVGVDSVVEGDDPNNWNRNTSIDTSDWKTYRNEKYGFEFKYPAGLVLTEGSQDLPLDLQFKSGNEIILYVGQITRGIVSDTAGQRRIVGGKIAYEESDDWQFNVDVRDNTAPALRIAYTPHGNDKNINRKIFETILASFKFKTVLPMTKNSCRVRVNGQLLPLDDDKSDFKEGLVCYSTIHQGFPLYTFDIKTKKQDGTGYVIDEVDINVESKLIQRVPIGDQTVPMIFSDRFLPLNTFAIEDINFDGYGDFRVKIDQGASGGNALYAFYLFNPTTKQFEFNQDFSNTIGTYKIIDNKILTHSSGGWAGSIFSENTYIVENNEPKLIELLEQQPTKAISSSGLMLTQSKLINGKMTEVRREEGSVDFKGNFW